MQTIFEIPGKGQLAITAGSVGIGGLFSFDMANLLAQDPTLAEGDNVFLRELTLYCLPVFKNTSGGSVTFDPERLMDVIRFCTLNAGGHLFFDLQEMAGSALRHIDQIQTRRQNQNIKAQSGGLVVGNGASSAAIPLVFSLRCYDHRGYNQEDGLIPVKLLQKAILTFRWCPSTEYPANVTVDSCATVRLSAQVVARDEYRAPSLWCWAEKKLQSLDDFMTPAGVTFSDLFVIANNNSSLVTKRKFANNDFNTVLYKVDGRTHTDTTQVADLIALYNSQEAAAAEDYISDPTLGTHDRIPIEWVEIFQGKITKKQHAENAPKIKFTSTNNIAVDNFRVLNRFHVDQTVEAIMRTADRAAVSIKKGSRLMPKTATKTNIDPKKANQARNLPVVIVPPGSPAG